MIAEGLGALAWARFQSACRAPLAAQARCLRQTLRSAARTGFGREHDLARVSRIADPVAMIAAYRDRVPVRDAAAMQADLDAVYAGDWQRLCATRPLWFAMTAGSSGRYKYIPVTAGYRRAVAHSSLIFQGALHSCVPEVRGARTQFLVGSAEGGLSPAGIPQGFTSGFNYRNLPRLLRRRFVVPYWVFTLDDPMERAYAAGRILVDEPRLGVLCAISPVNLINLRRALEQHADRLVHDVRHGTLTVAGKSAVAGQWRGRPAPVRARALNDAVRAGGIPARDLFPGLRVLVCWQGGNMGYYLDELRRAFGIDTTFEFPISASEGVFAIPHRVGQAGGILAVTSHFLEFLPDDGGTAGDALRADELEPGREYRLIVTNGGGLYRYDMEDIVRCTGRFRATPVIEFVAKKSRQVSVSNERVTELDVTQAMLETSRLTGWWFEQFLFVPCSDRRYRVVVDGSEASGAAAPLDDVGLRAFAAELDDRLRRSSAGYDFEREDALLEPLEVVVAAPGQLRRFLAEREPALQLPNAQIKPVHLTNEFDAHSRMALEVTYAP
jgi:hypothetical protein